MPSNYRWYSTCKRKSTRQNIHICVQCTCTCIVCVHAVHVLTQTVPVVVDCTDSTKNFPVGCEESRPRLQ